MRTFMIRLLGFVILWTAIARVWHWPGSLTRHALQGLIAGLIALPLQAGLRLWARRTRSRPRAA